VVGDAWTLAWTDHFVFKFRGMIFALFFAESLRVDVINVTLAAPKSTFFETSWGQAIARLLL